MGPDSTDLETAMTGTEAERLAAVRRLILDAWLRGWKDCMKAYGHPDRLDDPVRRHIIEQEVEFGMS